MDCRIARLFLEFARPLATELPGVEIEAVKVHLAECPECGPLARLENKVEDLIGQAIRAVPIPEGLRGRLVQRLQVQRTAQSHRRRLRYAAALLGVAAALLLAVWFGWQKTRPITFDPTVAANDLQGKLENPLPEKIEEEFRDTHISMVAPRDFNYGLLAFYGMDDFHEKRVPLLLFTHGREQARVYVLSDKEFDLPYALAHPQEVGSGCKAEIRISPEDPHFAYLIIYTGESLDEFRAEGHPLVAT